MKKNFLFFYLFILLFFIGCSGNKKNNSVTTASFDVSSQTYVDLSYAILSNASFFQVNYMYNHDGFILSDVVFECDGVSCSSLIDGIDYSLDISSFVPKSGKIYISDSDVYILEPLNFNGFSCFQDKISKLVNCIK